MKLNRVTDKAEKALKKLGQYKYVLIVIVAGCILLLWPSGDKKTEVKEQPGLTGTEEDFSVEALEERLSHALSGVEGAGEVTVILTVQSGMERVLATNRSADQRTDGREMEEEVVIISGENGEEAVLIGQNYPEFQGALIVCPGGDDPQVRLNRTRAVSVLTGLGTDRIAVCRGSK